MSTKARSIWMLLGSYGILVGLPIPLALLAEKLTDGIGGLLLLYPLLAWRIVAGLASSEFADHHHGVVWGISLLLYLALYSVFALPPITACSSESKKVPLAWFTRAISRGPRRSTTRRTSTTRATSSAS